MEQSLKILLADDEPSVTSSILWALRPLGHRIEIVNDGERALAKLAAEPTIDLLITDHSMPRMSGLELVGRLRETGYNGKILVLSAHLSHRNRAAYDSLEVNAMLPKPFDVDALRKTVGELFQYLPATL
ncbi:MAG: two-component system, chemotaxis family, chemotaxis protein CheY [Verrucomicrobiota bacterium]|jgi:two-component system response regulator (stage 0 sporulation protein F)